MASELRVDRIIPTGGIPTGGGGSIIQVVQGTKTDTSSVTGGTFGDVGLSASITPKFTSSKILIMVNSNISSSVGFDMKSRLMRGSTAIHIGDAAGNRPRASAAVTATYTGNQAYTQAPVAITYLDSPNTVSTTTYKLQMASYSSYIVYINRSGTDDNSTEYTARTASSITLMEISG